MTKTRIFPCWALDAEEKWLSALAAKGHYLSSKDGEVYVFEKGEPDSVCYAVEYAGKTHGDPARIAELEEKGFSFVGHFGRKRYYLRPAAEDSDHPSVGSLAELERLHTVQSNLMTAILLNIPGTLYCLLYIFLFIKGGLLFSDLANPESLPCTLGAMLGIFSFAVLFRWLSALNKRIKKVKL